MVFPKFIVIQDTLEQFHVIQETTTTRIAVITFRSNVPYDIIAWIKDFLVLTFQKDFIYSAFYQYDEFINQIYLKALLLMCYQF